MAGLNTVREALKTTLETITGMSGRVYHYVPGTQDPPSITIVPGTFIPGDTKAAITYDRHFGGQDQAYIFTLMIVVSSADNRQSGVDLDAFLATSGSKSVKAVIDNDPTLGGAVSFCVADRVIQYGALTWNGINYFGAQMVVEVNGP